MGRVDCEAEQEIAHRFHITKYPTLKTWRNQQVYWVIVHLKVDADCLGKCMLIITWMYVVSVVVVFTEAHWD